MVYSEMYNYNIEKKALNSKMLEKWADRTRRKKECLISETLDKA